MPQLTLLAIVGTGVFARLVPTYQRWFPRLWPRDPDVRQSVVTDLMYLFASPLSQVIAGFMTGSTLAAIALAIGHRPDMSVFAGFGPVTRQPRWLMLVEMYVLADLISYWTHRAAHAVPALWRLHRTHHTIEHIRGISFIRFHPLEVWELAPNIGILFLLGFPVDALAFIAPVTQLYAFLIHTQSRVAPRWLAYLFTFPAYHRWHHAKYIEGNGWNFGASLPIMDVIFGTYYYPKHEPEHMGIVEQVPKTFMAQLFYPFRRAPQPDVEPRIVEDSV